MSKSPVYIGAGSAELAVQGALSLIENAADSASHLLTVADWVSLTDGTTVLDRATNVNSGFYSAKEYAQGDANSDTSTTGGSAKSWAQDLPTSTSDKVDGATANDRSARAYASGSHMTGSTLGGSSKDWAQLTGTHVNTTFSSKEYAQGTTALTGGSAKDYAQYTDGAVRGETGDHSAKAWAVGGTGVTGVEDKGSAKAWATGTGRIDHNTTGGYSAKEHATGTTVAEGSAKEWAQTTGAPIDTTYSAKEYAQGSHLAAGGSAKNWAQLTTTPTTGTTDASAREWAIGTSTHKADASSKEYATHAKYGTVDGSSEYSAKHYSEQAQDWASKTDGQVKDDTGVTDQGYSAKEWATDTNADIGSAKDWATDTTAIVASTDYSSKEWAAGQLGANTSGSAKQWALGGGAFNINTAVEGSTYSARRYASDAEGYVDTFDDKYLGSHTTAYREVGTYVGKDNDGDALDDGALYYDTTLDVMKVWDDTGSVWKQLTPTTSEQTNINTLVTGYDGTTSTTPGTNLNIVQVDTVADNIVNVNKVGVIDSDVTKVAALGTNGADVTIVAGIGTNGADVTTVSNIGTNGADITTVSNIGTNGADVSTVAGITAGDITKVAIIPTGDVTKVAVIATGNVNKVAAIATGNVDKVAAIATGNVDKVAAIATGNVDLVAAIAAGNVDKVAVVDGEVADVAAVDGEIVLLGTANMAHPTTGHLALLGTTAMTGSTGHLARLGIADVVTDMGLIGATGVIGDIETVSDNISDVSNFADQYQISGFSPAPALDGGGNALTEGDLAFDTRTGEKGIKVWTGSAWSGGINTTEGVIVKHEYTGNGSTQHYVLDHDQGMEIVYLNGVKQLSGNGSDAKDYISVNGGSSSTYAGDSGTSTHIYFPVAPVSNDVISVVAWGASNNSLAVAIGGGTYSGAVTFNAGLTVAGAWTAASQTCANLGTVTTGAFTTITNLGNVTTTGTVGLGGKLTAGSNEIEGSNFDINGGDISSVTISGGLTWSAAQNLNSQNLTNVNIDSGTIDGCTITGALAGNASTATTLATGRTIGGVTFDGSANIDLPGVNTGGSQATSGNAATATLAANTTALANVRYIGGVAFDGTSNITLPGVNATGNQNTSGNAATATVLATARNINGVSFNGGGNITVTAAADTLTATTLKSTVVTSSLTSVGTLGALTVTGVGTISGIPITGAAGSESIAFGTGALGDASGADGCVGIGHEALDLVTSGDHNIGIGYRSSRGDTWGLTTGNYNVCIGYRAGYSMIYNHNNIMIGTSCGPGANNADHVICIGEGVKANTRGISIGHSSGSTGSDIIKVGKSGNYIYANYTSSGTWTQSSDIRKKTDVVDNSLGLNFIDALRTVNFKWRPAEEHPEEWEHFTDKLDEDGTLIKRTYADMDTETLQYGMIAQEVKEAITSAGADTFEGWTETLEGCQGTSLGAFVLPLIKAVQELSAKVKALEAGE